MSAALNFINSSNPIEFPLASFLKNSNTASSFVKEGFTLAISSPKSFNSHYFAGYSE